MDSEAEYDESYEADPETILQVQRLLKEAEASRKRHLHIARIIRLVRRPDGRELTDVAIVHRVPGSTLADVRQVRAEIDALGVCQAEMQGPAEREGGEG